MANTHQSSGLKSGELALETHIIRQHIVLHVEHALAMLTSAVSSVIQTLWGSVLGCLGC